MPSSPARPPPAPRPASPPPLNPQKRHPPPPPPLHQKRPPPKKAQRPIPPATPPQIPGLCAVGWAQTASVTGGDAYDLWAMADGRMGIFLGDASGHGIAPALVVSQARTLIRALSEINCDPLWLLSRVNARLASDLE